MALSLVLDEHRAYLADEARISSFRRAVREVVQPGDVVVDLGAGTGILGLLACQAGASRIYSIDEGSIIGLTEAIYHDNGFADRVIFIKRFSTRVDLPEKADVVLSDQIGRFGFDAGALEFFSDARQRFLKPDGTIIPARIDLYAAAVESKELFANVEFWNGRPADFEFRTARIIAANTGYPAKLEAENLLSEPARLASLDILSSTTDPFRIKGRVRANRGGQIHGIGGWFSAQLSPSVAMNNSPLAAERINRRNVFFPIAHPVTVTRGDWVQINMHIVPAEKMVTWKVEIGSDGARPREVFQHSTFNGMLLCREDLRRSRPGFIPTLTPWGGARLTVLTLCDGSRPLSEIEQEVSRRHAELFRSVGEAAAFVAEVVANYSK